MEPTQSAAEVLRFGIFELDQASGELRRNGNLVRLPPQPFQVLQLLVQSAGQVVDRNRIRREVWGGTTVDFDRSLNVCIAQVRAALNDDAENPRFIQTLPRRGYRFLASVERPGEPAPAPDAPPPPPVRRWPRAAVFAGLLVALAVTGYRLTHTPAGALRIAVLPFDTVGLSAEDNTQVEGLFDELLTRLAGVQPDRMRVIGRRSVLGFRNQTRPLREIGERLDVAYAIETTARREGNRLRLTARLAQTGTQTLLWSETFEQESAPADFEEDFVARTSTGVLAKLFPNSAPPPSEALCRAGWDAYRTGRLLANQGTISAMQRSLPYFEQAECPAARAALAETLLRLVRFDPRHRDYWERARAAAREALKSEPANASAHLSLGGIAFWHDWNWKTADSEYQAALRRNPSDPDAHHDFAWLQVALGRRSAALASLRTAIALDPLSARTNMDSAWLLLQAGRYTESAAHARRALELNPEMGEAYSCLSRALLYSGDESGAVEVMRAHASLPAARTMRDILETALRANPNLDPYQRAWRLAWIGSPDQALDALDQAFQNRSLMTPMIAVDPAFTSLRDHPRFRKIVHALGL